MGGFETQADDWHFRSQKRSHTLSAAGLAAAGVVTELGLDCLDFFFSRSDQASANLAEDWKAFFTVLYAEIVGDSSREVIISVPPGIFNDEDLIPYQMKGDLPQSLFGTELMDAIGIDKNGNARDLQYRKMLSRWNYINFMGPRHPQKFWFQNVDPPGVRNDPVKRHLPNLYVSYKNMFMLKTNPGPDLGIAMAYQLTDGGEATHDPIPFSVGVAASVDFIDYSKHSSASWASNVYPDNCAWKHGLSPGAEGSGQALQCLLKTWKSWQDESIPDIPVSGVVWWYELQSDGDDLTSALAVPEAFW